MFQVEVKKKTILNGLKEDFDDILLPLESSWNSDALEAQAFAYLSRVTIVFLIHGKKLQELKINLQEDY